MGDLDFIGGIAQAVGNFISGERANQTNVQMQDSANRANIEIADKRNLQEMAMWDKQTAYNSPVAQMTRLRDAGLNPALVYGNGSPAGQMSSPPSLETPSVNPARVEKNPIDVLAGLSAYQQIENLNAQHANIIADVKLKQQQGQKINKETELTQTQVEQQKIVNENIKHLNERGFHADVKDNAIARQIQKVGADVTDVVPNVAVGIWETLQDKYKMFRLKYLVEEQRRKAEIRRLQKGGN